MVLVYQPVGIGAGLRRASRSFTVVWEEASRAGGIGHAVECRRQKCPWVKNEVHVQSVRSECPGSSCRTTAGSEVRMDMLSMCQDPDGDGCCCWMRRRGLCERRSGPTWRGKLGGAGAPAAPPRESTDFPAASHPFDLDGHSSELLVPTLPPYHRPIESWLTSGSGMSPVSRPHGGILLY